MKALIADDHELFRAGVRCLLAQMFQSAEIVEAGSLDEALQRLGEGAPADLLIFDLHMPGVAGVETIAALREQFCGAKLVIMSARDGRSEVGAALASGIDAYIPKSLSASEIATAMQKVMSGHVFVPPLERKPDAAQPPARPKAAGAAPLTERQRHVLDELVTGKSSKEIARALDIAEGTVKVHLAAIYRMLDVRTRAEAIAKIRDFGLSGAARYHT